MLLEPAKEAVLATLIPELDQARIAGDETVVEEVQRKIQVVTGGKQRKITGKGVFVMPKIGTLVGFKMRGRVENFEEWNKH
jgi:hypothetical protein